MNKHLAGKFLENVKVVRGGPDFAVSGEATDISPEHKGKWTFTFPIIRVMRSHGAVGELELVFPYYEKRGAAPTLLICYCDVISA